MGCHLSHSRLPFQKKWTTPVKPFDPKKKKVNKSKTKSTFWKMVTKAKNNRVHPNKVETIRVRPALPAPSPPPPAPRSIDSPPHTSVFDNELFKGRVTRQRPLSAVYRQPRFHLSEPLPSVGVGHSLRSRFRPRTPLERPDIDNKLPPLRVRSRPTPQRCGRRLFLPPIDENHLFDYPDPVLQDADEPDLTYGRYDNRCPTRCGVRFDLVFKEAQINDKPILSIPEGPKRRGKEAKTVLNKKQEAAKKRRIVSI